MPLDDDDPDKWVMRAHTDVKHTILTRYLTSWMRVLSSGHKKIHYFDGFAGRGRYENGEPGSPLLAMDTAARHDDLLENFLCTFVELNDSNYENLEKEVELKKKECGDVVDVITRNDAFEEVVDDLIEGLDGDTIVPSFFFIDPFGYDSMPFESVSDIINLRETGVEVFLTFMVRDIRRFLENEGHENSITRILGNERWKDIPEKGVSNVEEEILKLYEQQLKTEAGARYVWPFEMKMPERRETVYYLIHATNHFKGFKIMKDVMYNAGAEDQFAYLGPDHYAYESDQQTLFQMTGAEDDRIEDLAEFLFSRFEGSTLKFWDIMKETYLETDLIEKHYRKAIYYLEDKHRVQIDNNPHLSNGTERGLQHDDEVTFQRKYSDVTSFC